MNIIKMSKHKNLAVNPLKILLAENHALTAKIEKNGLEEGGFVVELVNDGGALLKRVQNQKFDILLLDNTFQELALKSNVKNAKANFSALLLKIKNTSINSELKIVVTTVFSEELAAFEKQANKIDLVLLKPIPIEKLIYQLKELNLKKTREHNRTKTDLLATIYIDNKVIQDNVMNLSPIGLFLTDKTNCIQKPIGDSLKIGLFLPKFKNPVLFNALIVRKKDDGYGLKIVDMSHENRIKIEKYIEKQGLKRNLDKYYL